MAFPNLIGLIGLSGVVFKETRLYFDGLKIDKKKLMVDITFYMDIFRSLLILS